MALLKSARGGRENALAPEQGLTFVMDGVKNTPVASCFGLPLEEATCDTMVASALGGAITQSGSSHLRYAVCNNYQWCDGYPKAITTTNMNGMVVVLPQPGSLWCIRWCLVPCKTSTHISFQKRLALQLY